MKEVLNQLKNGINIIFKVTKVVELLWKLQDRECMYYQWTRTSFCIKAEFIKGFLGREYTELQKIVMSN